MSTSKRTLLPSRSNRHILCASIATVILGAVPHASAVDGSWIQNQNPGGIITNVWSDSANWFGGTIADGLDANAYLVYNPGVTGGDVGANILLDSSRTLGNLFLADVDGINNSSVAFASHAAGPVTLTLQTTTGTPTIDSNLLLNNGFSQKKGIVQSNGANILTIAGTQGFNKTGLGMISLRANMALTGNIGVLGGILDTRVAINNNISVGGAGTLSLDYATFNNNNILGTGTTLSLGGTAGSGYVTSTARGAVTAQTVAGVTLNAGGHSIQANAQSGTNTFTWNLGTITRNAGSAVNLFGSNTFTFNFTSGGSVTGNDASGIIGGWITHNTNDWARVNGTAITNFTTYTNNTWAPGTNTTANAVNFLSLPGVNTISSGTTHTLRIQDGQARIINLSGTNTIETGGVLFGNSGNAMHQLQGGAITPGAGVSDLILHSYSNGGGWGVIVNSDIVDNGAPVQLVKAGNGNVVIDGDKSFTGGTILGQGTLILGKALGGSATGSVTGPIVNSGVLAFNRSGTYTPTNTITGNGVVAQYSDGTLVLNQAVSAGGLDIRNGAVTLDFGAVSAPDNNIVPAGAVTPNGLNTGGGRLSLRDGVLNINGGAGENHSQTFAVTDIQGSTQINLSPSAGGTIALNLGAHNRPNNNNDGAGTLKLSLGTGASVNVMPAFPGAASSLIADNGQAFVTVGGSDWGAKNAANNAIVGGSTIAGFYTPMSTLTAASNADYDSDAAVAANTTFGSLRFNSVAAPATLSVNAGVQLNLGGVLVTPGATAATNIAGPGAIAAANTGNRDLIFFQNSDQPLTVSAVIANNSAGQVTHIVKEGSGTLILSAANTLTGKTFVQGGLLRMTGGNIGTATTAAGNIFVREGEMRLEGSASVHTGGNFISIGERLGESGTLSLQGTSTWTTLADFNVSDVNSTGTLNVQDSAALTVNNLYLGKVGSSVGTLNLSGNGSVTINTGGGDARFAGNSSGNGTDSISQGIVNQSGGTFTTNKNTQIGAYGIATYNQTNGTYQHLTGGFTVLGRFVSGQGTWNLSGGTINTQGTTGAALIVGENGLGTLNVSGTGNVLARTLSLGHVNGVGVVNQTAGTVSLNSTGVLTGLSNAQAGVVLGGGGLGNNPFSTGTYNLDGGTLSTFAVTKGVGTGTFNFNGGTIQANANNPAFMQGLTAANVNAGGAKIDTQGFNVNIGQGLAHDAALGATVDGGLTKSGTGTLSLHGESSYTGATTVSNGTLRLAATDASAVWDADTLAGADGSSVATWTDTAGAKNAAQGTAVNQPQVFSNQINGHKVVRFNSASSQSLVVPGADSVVSGSASFTIAAVVKTSSAGTAGPQWYNNTGIVDMEIGGANYDWGLVYNDTGKVGAGLGNFNAPGDQTLYSTGSINDGNAHLLVYSMNSGVLTLSVDGVTQSQSTGNAAARTINQFRIGGLQTGGGFFNGDIAEIRMYRSGMNEPALGVAGNELAAKFGIAASYSNVSNYLPDTSNVNLSASGTALDINGFNETIGSLSGVAGSTVTLGTGGTLKSGADNTSTAFAGGISGAGSLAKVGTGAQTLGATSASNYTGTTTVDEGALIVRGTISGTSSVAVNDGGTLGGDGSVTTAGNGNIVVASGGKLAPGASPGTLSLNVGTGQLDVSGAVSLVNSQAFVFEIGASSDVVALTAGTLNIGSSTLEFDDFNFIATGLTEGTYTLFDTSSTILGTLGTNISGDFGGLLGTIEIAPGGQDLVLTVVPEPTSIAGLIAGLGLVVGFGRRRRRS